MFGHILGVYPLNKALKFRPLGTSNKGVPGLAIGYHEFLGCLRKNCPLTSFLVGGLEHLLFSISYTDTVWDVILPIDFHIFQDGLNHQPDSSLGETVGMGSTEIFGDLI